MYRPLYETSFGYIEINIKIKLVYEVTRPPRRASNLIIEFFFEKKFLLEKNVFHKYLISTHFKD